MGPRTSPRTQHRPQGCHFVVNCARPSPRRELPRAVPGLMRLCVACAPPPPPWNWLQRKCHKRRQTGGWTVGGWREGQVQVAAGGRVTGWGTSANPGGRATPVLSSGSCWFKSCGHSLKITSPAPGFSPALHTALKQDAISECDGTFPSPMCGHWTPTCPGPTPPSLAQGCFPPPPLPPSAWLPPCPPAEPRVQCHPSPSCGSG